MKPELFIGALSGTSIDGIDVALVRFTPQPVLVASHSLPYPEELRRELLTLCTPGDNEIDRLGRADVVVGRCFAQAVNELLAKAALPADAICAVGSHGQTIRHRPGGAAPFTLQIGDPNVIAALTWGSRSPQISAARTWPSAARARPWCRRFTRRFSASPGRTGWWSTSAALRT